jgi:NADP-dependent 3-hydroxy acid dehydrogenase YdfG
LVNVGGAMIALQVALPAMVAAKAGTVLLTGGGLAVDPWPHFTSLAVGKGALRNLALCLQKDPALTDVHTAHVIVHARITEEVAHRIAALYWELHAEPRDHWRNEEVFRE